MLLKCLKTILWALALVQLYAEEVAAKEAARTVLKVAPYPYLPDSVGDNLKSLLDYMTSHFEAAYPNVTVELRPMNARDDFYDLSVLSQWLASDGSGYDVVEVDTALLGDLVVAGLLAPQFVLPATHSDWIAPSAAAVQFNQALYGYPHIMCATVLFTRDASVANVTTIDQLSEVLKGSAMETYRLVGNLNSSWALPGLWINSYQDSSPSQSELGAFALHAYEQQTFRSLAKLARLCGEAAPQNPCLNGTFRQQPELPTLLFAQKQAKALFGYSENLFAVLQHAAPEDYDNIQMIPLPVGTLHNRPVFATDAYVFRRNMSIDVLNAARAFVEFMASPRMQAALVGSGDSPHPNTSPRYLLPMSKGAYDEPLLASNRFYQRFFRNLSGFTVPTAGYLNTREALAAAILKDILK